MEQPSLMSRNKERKSKNELDKVWLSDIHEDPKFYSEVPLIKT